MKKFRLRAAACWSVAGAMLVLMGCAATQLHSEGMQLLAEGKQDAALDKLREATRLEPSNAGYRIDYITQAKIYAAQLVEQGNDLRKAGQQAEAGALYARALKADPSSEQARQAMLGLALDARTARLVAESVKLQQEGNLAAARERAEAALADNPTNLAAQRQLESVRELIERGRQLREAQNAALSLMNKPVTLQFRDANLRMVFEALSRTTGLNVILDRDVRADLKTTIFVKDASVEDTVDLILLQNQLQKRPLNANTLFVYPATPAKQREYQDLLVRTFQVSNVDVKYIQTVLKTVLKIKDVSVDERNGTLVMRDTADAIAVAAKIIAAHDVPEPEVMLEVEVLEMSHSRLSNLGVKFPEKVVIAVPGEANTIGALRALSSNDLVVSKLAAEINLKLQYDDTNVLASPRIRAKNKEKARILIGDRVPIITNTVTPTAGGTGVVTGSVQYQDVGLKLEFEPQVFSDQEVGIRISLEVSHIVKEIQGPEGSLAYQIGTRNAQTAVRLRDGETQILGGLISADERNASDRIPGLGWLPILGRLFANETGTNVKSELVLSITPHIVRPPASLDPAVRTIFSGTEGEVRERRLQLDPIGSVTSRSNATGAGPAGAPAAPAAPPARTSRPPTGARPNLPLVNSNRGATAGDPPPAPEAAATAPATPEPAAAPPPADTDEPKAAPQ